MNADDAPILIDLAREAGFALGAAAVRPSTRELVAGERVDVLEPRVMQVLVVLARRRGQVVSRDDLIASCWGGRVVGEDAISRCIAAIRRLSEAHGGFAVTTVARVGYRLEEPMSACAAEPAPGPVLAVLAFDNLSGDADLAYFSDGVSEEILQTVARGSVLKVIGRGSSFQFRGPEKAARKVGAELNATHVLDGSVRRSGSRVRIAAHLIECDGETTLWSDRFDRDLADVFALQDEIAAAVAAALQTTFTRAEPVGKIDPAAYDLYLQARLTSFSELSTSVAALERAVTLAPQFAPAWAALAFVRALHLREGRVPMASAARAAAVDAAERALSLDPGAGMAYAALGQLQPRGAYIAREALLDKAVAVAPRDPQTLAQLGWFLPTVGRNQEALQLASQSLDLDPLNYPAAILFAMLLGAVGRYEDCLQAFASFREQWPIVDVSAPLHYAASVGDWQRFEQLRQSIDGQEAVKPSVAEAISLGDMLRNPNPRSHQLVLQAIDDQLAGAGTIEFGWLVQACRMGSVDEAFSFIDRASFAHLLDEDGPPPAANLTPGIIFDRIANRAMMTDVRFAGFCSKIGLCGYWVRTGRWPDCADEGVLPYDFKTECRRAAAV
jgi:adenylate cyclase